MTAELDVAIQRVLEVFLGLDEVAGFEVDQSDVVPGFGIFV